jgi:hypothetical protein
LVIAIRLKPPACVSSGRKENRSGLAVLEPENSFVESDFGNTVEEILHQLIGGLFQYL